MKSYLQGLITGGVFVFAFMVLMGSNNDEVGRYQLGLLKKNDVLIDTKTAKIYELDMETYKWRNYYKLGAGFSDWEGN